MPESCRNLSYCTLGQGRADFILHLVCLDVGGQLDHQHVGDLVCERGLLGIQLYVRRLGGVDGQLVVLSRLSTFLRKLEVC